MTSARPRHGIHENKRPGRIPLPGLCISAASERQAAWSALEGERRPSRNCRSEYPFRIPVICMNAPLVTKPCGFPNFGVFVTLFASKRNSNRRVAPKGKPRRETCRGSRHPGHKTGCAPCCRTEHLAAAPTPSDCQYTPLAPISPTFVTSPTRSAVCMLLGVFGTAALAVMLKGVPLNAANVPASCQSATTALAMFV